LLSGTTVTGATGLFTTLTALTGSFTNLNFTSANIGGDLTVSGSGFIVSGLSVSGTVSGVTFTGTTGQFITVTGTNANFTNGTFSTLTGVTTVVTTGVFGAGSAAAPSIAFTGDLNTGIYSPGADTIAFTEGGAEAMRIDSSGRLLIGTSTARTVTSFAAGGAQLQVESTIYQSSSLSLINNQVNADSSYFLFGKSRGTSTGSATIVNNNDLLGALWFTGADGTSLARGAMIEAFVDGTPGAADMPCRLVFSTSADGSATPTERMRIDSSGNVGIGTSAPGSALDVRFGTSPATDNGVGANTLRVWTSSALAINTGGAISLGGVSGAGSSAFGQIAGRKINATSNDYSGYLQFATNDSGGTMGERMRIDASGRVGIGTSSPATALDVVGQINATTGYASTLFGVNTTPLSTTSTTQSFLRFKNTGGDFYAGIESSTGGAFFTGSTAYAACLYNAASTPLQFFTGGTLRATIDTAGKLLIGTSTARSVATQSSLFQIEGTSFATTGLSSCRNSNDVYSSYLHFGKTRGSVVGSNTIVSSGDDLGGLIFGGGDGTSVNSQAAYILCQVDGTPGVGDMPGRLVFWTTPDGAASPTERMRIDSSGRVGIGTTSPSNQNTTQVTSDNDGIRVQLQATPVGSQGPRLIFGHSTNNGTQQIFAAIKSLMMSGNDAAWSSDLAFYTGGSSLAERLRIDSSGKVGIGTASPGDTLHVSGSIRADVDLKTINQGKLNLGSNQGGGAVLVYNSNGNLDISPRSGFSTTFLASDGGTERARIDSSGRVGIGTTSPGAAIHSVAAVSTLPAIFDAPTSGYSYVPWRYNGTAYGYVGQAAGLVGGGSNTDLTIRSENNLLLAITGTERARIDSSGNFLVGTSTAAPSLATGGIGLAATTGRKLDLYQSTDSHQGLGTDLGGGPYELSVYGPAGITNQGTIRFGFISHANPGTWTERMRIEASGNVGIGVTPVTKLDLSGNYAQNITAVAALDLNLSTSNYFTKTINANSTFTVSNTPASRAFSFTLELTHTSGTVTWFANVEWPAGTPPTLTTGKTHLFMFVTDDGGSRWRASSLINYTN
jgi:hypothetical protein